MSFLRRAMTVLGVVVFGCILLNASSSIAQEAQGGTAVTSATGDHELLRIVFQIQGSQVDKKILESVESSLQDLDGVSYIGVNYQTSEVTVRFDSVKAPVEKLRAAISRIGRYPISIVAGPEAVKSITQDRVLSGLSNITFECLRHDEAHALCERHFQKEVPEGVDLENCYTVKVDFKTVAHVDKDYDWLSQACLVDENGKLVKPLAWLEFPPVTSGSEKLGAGLLIFPKIKGLPLGLNLRLLRANGEGYDSFTIEAPAPIRDQKSR